VARLNKPFTTAALLRAVEHLVAMADPDGETAG
jgi:hypothetical protein